MSTIFLTGATGYIGGTLAARLVETGTRVRGLVRNSDSAAQSERRDAVCCSIGAGARE